MKREENTKSSIEVEREQMSSEPETEPVRTRKRIVLRTGVRAGASTALAHAARDGNKKPASEGE